MRDIKKLTDEMIEELCSAREYAIAYTKYSDSNTTKAKRLADMANDEIRHATYLHEMAVELINQYRANHSDIPDYMADMWDEKHKEYIDEIARIKVILAM